MATKKTVSEGVDTHVTEAQLNAEARAAAKWIQAEERVEVYIERGNATDEPNLFVSVNGYNCLLPKGKTSLVPRSVAEEVARSKRAQRKLDATMDALREAADWQR